MTTSHDDQQPTVAHYTRRRAEDMPTAPAEQLADAAQLAANRLTYADAVRIRRQIAALDLALARLISEEKATGRRAVDIARELDLTESYVHRLIRQHRAAQAAPAAEAMTAEAEQLADDPEAHREAQARRRAHARGDQ